MQLKPPSGRVLIMGGGFLGSHVASVFRAAGSDVSVFTRSLPAGFRQHLFSGAEIQLGDALEIDMGDVVRDGDHIVYALGSVYPAESALDPMGELTTTLKPLLGLLEAMRRREGTSLMFISSGGTVYGDAGTMPIPESAPTHPDSGYGVLKLAAEKYIEMYIHRYGLPAVIARVANPYGPGQQVGRGQGVVASFLANALEGRSATVFGDGGNIRDYIYVEDVALALLRLSSAGGVPQVVNVGSGCGHSITEVLKLVEAISGLELSVEYLPDRGFDVRANILDTSVFRRITGLRPRSLEVGISQTWAYLTEQL